MDPPQESRPATSGPPSPPRETPLSEGRRHHRPSCNLCRQRKVKCDRQQPCSICVRVGSECVYPLRHGRAPKRSRHGVTQLADRLAQLESLIKRFETHQRPSNASDDPQDAEPSPSPILNESKQMQEQSPMIDGQLGRLMSDETKSYYVSNVLWEKLASEVEEIREMLLEPMSEEEEVDDEDPVLGFERPSSLGTNAAIFGFRAIAHSLESLRPSASQSMSLFSLFTENVAPLIRIFHLPTLSTYHRQNVTTRGTSSPDKNAEAMMFAIYYSAIISIDSDQCIALLGMTRPAALDRYRFAVEQALARADLLNTQSMMLLKAAVLFISALRNHDNSRTTWSLTSLLFHIAQAMGLHRDGELFKLTPFQTEMRRRLWWQICILDNRSSDYHGYEPIVQLQNGEAKFDTRLPLNVNDSDLHPDMLEPPVELWDGKVTDMTLTLLRCEAMRMAWKLFNTSGPSRKIATGDEPGSLLVDRGVLIRQLEQTFHQRYLGQCDESDPYQLLSSILARLVLKRFWIMAHCPTSGTWSRQGNPPDGNQAPDSAADRESFFLGAIEILEWCSVLLTRKDMSQWAWYTKTHIQWHTMAFVLSELCSRPPSPECNRAWKCISTVYDIWKINGGAKDTLSRPIRKLMAKARYVQQMQQQAQPGENQPALNRGQLPEVNSSLPIPGYVSNSWPWHGDVVDYQGQQEASEIAMLDPFADLMADLPVDVGDIFPRGMYDDAVFNSWTAM